MLHEDSTRLLRVEDDPAFLRKRQRVRALSEVGSGSVFKKYIKGSNTVVFRTKSSGEHESTRGRTWTQRVRLLSLPKLVREARKNGTKVSSAVRASMLEGDVKVTCDCPADLYWGFQFIRSQLGPPHAAQRAENRFPSIRNPGLKGRVCKHLRQVMAVIPFNSGTIARELNTRKRRSEAAFLHDPSLNAALAIEGLLLNEIGNINGFTNRTWDRLDETVKEVLSIRRYKAGYEVRTELRGDDGAEKDYEACAAYTPEGHYIGDPKWAHRLVVGRGIAPVLAEPGDSVCSIGFCVQEQKWYGWSHRAICGFGVGDRVSKNHVCAISGLTDEYLETHPEEDKSLWPGFTATTLDDAQIMAMSYADGVS